MTALLLTEVFPPQTGGSGRWFWEIYRRQPRDRSFIIAGNHCKHEAFDKSHDLRVIRLPLSMKSWGVCRPASIYRHGRLVQAVRRHMRQFGASQLHCGKCLPEGTIALALKWLTGTPYLVYVHGEELQFVRTSRELTWLTRRVLQGASCVIANSQNTASMLEGWHVPTERVHIVNPGVDVHRFVPIERNSVCRDRMGWRDRTVVLTVSRLQRRKGHDTMIRALPLILRQFPNVLYAVVGEGEERERLENLTEQLTLRDNVQFMGEVGDDIMVQCYQQCDLFVLPNRQVGNDIEGFGMVLLEAQACGKPVIAGASGGTAETMRVGETGCVVPCDQPEPLAEAVIHLLNDREKRETMGAAGRKWTVENFDWSVLSQQLCCLWAETERAKNPSIDSVVNRASNSIARQKPATNYLSMEPIYHND